MRARKIPNISADKQRMRAKQQADYAAQAACLPQDTILVVLEDTTYNGDYDLLFPPKQGLPKVPLLDNNAYTSWANTTSESNLV